jgi:hypothetical protein
VKLHSVFLRNDCILPGHLDPLTEAFGDHWMCVKMIPAAVFDTMIRQAGWHYIWMTGACSRAGWARTSEKAIEKALDRALEALSWQSNAADFESVRVTKYPGFHVANVTVARRRIQELSLMEEEPEEVPRLSRAKQHG